MKKLIELKNPDKRADRGQTEGRQNIQLALTTRAQTCFLKKRESNTQGTCIVSMQSGFGVENVNDIDQLGHEWYTCSTRTKLALQLYC